MLVVLLVVVGVATYGLGNSGVALAAGSSEANSASASTGLSYQYGNSAQVQKLLTDLFGAGNVRLGQLPAVVRQAIKIYAKPVTAQEKATIVRCLKTTGPCNLDHPQGTIKLVEAEESNNDFYTTARAENILMAIREPAVKTITYTNANGTVPQSLTNFRTSISQGANVIISSFAFANVMLPVVRQAASKHITVWAANQTIPGAKFNGSDLSGDVLDSLCDYGKRLADTALASGKSVAMYTGLAGSAFATGWQGCAKKEIAAKGGTIVENGLTGWTPQGEQQAAAALVAQGTLPNSLIYDFTPVAFIQKFLSLGSNPPTMVAGGNTMASYTAWKSAIASGHPFKIYAATAEQIYDPVALHAAVVEHLGGKVPPHLVIPQFILPIQSYHAQYSASLPGGASFNTGLPNAVLAAAFKDGAS